MSPLILKRRFPDYMSLLQQVKLLKQRYDLKTRLNDSLITKELRKKIRIEQDMQQLDEAVVSIKKMRDGLYPQGEFSRGKLFALQRSQAALRRKIAELAMQRAKKDKEHEECEKKAQVLTQYKHQLMKKTDKYEYLRKSNSVSAICKKSEWKSVK